MCTWHVWSRPLAGIDLGGGSQDFSTVIVTSRDPGFVPTGSLNSICTGNPTLTFCYAYDGSLRGGISFIHSYNGGGLGSADDPIVRGIDDFVPAVASGEWKPPSQGS